MMKQLFKYCEIKPLGKQWGVFSIAPINDKSYVWFIKRSDGYGHFLCIPTWTDTFKKDIKSLPLETCRKLARDYDNFCDNSEWF